VRKLRVISLAAAGVCVVALAVGVAEATTGSGVNDWPYQTGSHDARGRTYTLAAVGDIACEPDTAENASTPASLKCGSPDEGGLTAEYATAAQADAMHPDLVALLGDEQYEVGKLSDFENSFEQAWGGLKMLERPSPGNHEYYAYTKHGDNETAQNGAGYFAYFNGHDQAGTPYAQGQAGDDTDAAQGWYSYNIGHWHVISLNIECASAPFGNDCSTTDGDLLSQETQWLAADLRADHSQCTMAYWHQPTFSATTAAATGVPDPSAPGVGSTEGGAADVWWKLLYKAHASLILNGHEHVYARFRPMNPAGQSDPERGIPQIIVGTGGEDLDTLATSGTAYSNPNVVTAQDEAFGILELKLRPNGYSFTYKPAVPGPGFSDSALQYSDHGAGSCRG
jgi:acid phosphatase type 7